MSDLAIFGFSPSIFHKLIESGFRTNEDFNDIDANQLANECSINFQDAMDVLSKIGKIDLTNSNILNGMKSAWELYKEQEKEICISTKIKELDTILGGGIQSGEMTEIYGVPGIGKTQFAMQVALSAIVHSYDNETPLRKAIYIDSEGGLTIQRIVQMTDTLLLNNKIKREDILSNFLYFRVHDYQEQYQVINGIEDFLIKHENIQIIIVDSLTFHFRHEFDDYVLRTKLIQNMGLQLQKLATKYKISIFLINHMTTKGDNNSQINSIFTNSTLIPALGDTWSNLLSTRLLLKFNEKSERLIELVKSNSNKLDKIFFKITNQGLLSINPLKRSADIDDCIIKKEII